jgi:hypothetical protein
MASAVIMDPQAWAQAEFGECELGDVRRTKRLVKYAVQAAARPDEGTPDQVETWAALKAVYRLFDAEQVTFQNLLAPHCQRTRAGSAAGEVKLIINDTTEMNFTTHHAATGLGSVGGPEQQGFFVHSALMLDAASEVIEGLAGQELFHRRGAKQGAKNARRRDPQREQAVWGQLMERVGRPPEGATWLHVCDRGADDFEVMLRAIRQGCGFVIRASKLNRQVRATDGRALKLDRLPAQWPVQSVREISVKEQGRRKARKARVELRFGEVLLPLPRITTAWIREHAPEEPLRLRVVELREVPKSKSSRTQPLRWLLYTTEEVPDVEAALRIVRYYELRWTIEDFHKCWKTGCAIESRRYETAERLERVAAVTAVVAVRLLRMRTVAKETPDRLAREVAPRNWVDMIILARHLRKTPATLTIHEFLRAMGGLGGHLGRKHDGEPGWITLWRGYEKLQLMLRGAKLAGRCG